MALANMGLKRPKLVSFWEGEQNVKENEKRKKKRKKMEESSQASQGMELWIFGMEIELKYGILRLCMVNSLSPNLGF